MEKLKQTICGFWFEHDFDFASQFCRDCGIPATELCERKYICLEFWLNKIWQKLNPVRVNGKICKHINQVPLWYFYKSENGYELEKMR